MSVYTEITLESLKSWLANYDLGLGLKLEPIANGTVNSNYYLTTETGRYILTLFETLPINTVQTILSLTEFLADHDVLCPAPIKDKQSQMITTLANKPAAIISCLPGRSLQGTTLDHCQQMGRWLAHMHLVSKNYPQKIPNVMGESWRQQTTEKLLTLLSNEDRDLVSACWKLYQSTPWRELPSGIIHADLFRDNVLFNDNQLTGVIDFYFSCSGAFIYDLAILCNDWCINPQGELEPEKITATIDAYETIRPLKEIENKHWGLVQASAASRFWLSRLASYHFPRGSSDALVLTKDPLEFKRRVIDCIEKVNAPNLS